jgi:hypothetical protein
MAIAKRVRKVSQRQKMKLGQSPATIVTPAGHSEHENPNWTCIR